MTYEIFNGNDEIADLLFNNMFPVAKEYIKGIIIDPQKDTFLANEQRFIRKNWIDINNKAIEVYRRRYDETKLNYKFYEKLCCDFHKLEKLLSDYMQNNQEKINKILT